VRTFALAVAAVVTAHTPFGSASAETIECSGAHKPQRVAELIFGRGVGGPIEISEAQWMQFVDTEITPRFPDGLTVYDATGQWRDKTSNKITRETSKIVLIVLSGRPEDLSGLNEIAEAYKRTFGQQSVGMIVRPACVSF
jgi:hypothetical protein